MGVFSPYWERKVWGRVMHVFASPRAAVSYLAVEAGSWCSRHYHQDRTNVFVSITAILEIKEWGPWGERSRLVKPGSSYTVPAGILHQFHVLQDGEVIEIYYAEHGGNVRLDDIHRLDEGGRNAIHGKRIP